MRRALKIAFPLLFLASSLFAQTTDKLLVDKTDGSVKNKAVYKLRFPNVVVNPTGVGTVDVNGTDANLTNLTAARVAVTNGGGDIAPANDVLLYVNQTQEFDNVQAYATSFTNVTSNAKDSGGTPFSLRYNQTTRYTAFGKTASFDRIYFDIDTASSPAATLQGWYWNGSAWNTTSVTDDTAGLTTDGSLFFTPPSDWANTGTVNSITGVYWFLMNSTGATPTTTATAFLAVPSNNTALRVYAQPGDSNVSLEVRRNGGIWFQNAVNTATPIYIGPSTGVVQMYRSSTDILALGEADGFLIYDNDIQTTPSSLIQLSNSQASTAGTPVQMPPALGYYGRVWNTNGAGNNAYVRLSTELKPISNDFSNVAYSGQYRFRYQFNATSASSTGVISVYPATWNFINSSAIVAADYINNGSIYDFGQRDAVQLGVTAAPTQTTPIVLFNNTTGVEFYNVTETQSVIGNGSIVINHTTGTVGIGTLDPTENTKLDVNSSDQTARFTSGATTTSVSGRAFQIATLGESYSRGIMYSNGVYGIGNGVAVRDVFLGRSKVGTLAIGTAVNLTGSGNLSVGGTMEIDGGTLYLNNTSNPAQILSNTGNITLGGVGLTNNEQLKLNFESAADLVQVTSPTGAVIQFSPRIKMSDNTRIDFGGGNDAGFYWSDVGNDNFQFGIFTSSATQSGYFSIMSKNDMGVDNRSPLATSINPVFRIYSNDNTSATDYIELYHDQTDANITVGSGRLNINRNTVATTTDSAVKVSWPHVLSDSNISFAIWGELNNTDDIAPALGMHAGGIIGRVEDMATSATTLYGVEGRADGRGDAPYYIGTLGFTDYRGAAFAGQVAIGTEGRAYVTTDGSTELNEGVIINLYSPSYIGGATGYGLWVLPQTNATTDVGARIDAASDRTLWISGNTDSTTPQGGILFGSSVDTNLYRSAANTLRTDDSFQTGDNIAMLKSGSTGYILAYDSGSTKATAMYHNGTDGAVGTTSGRLNLATTVVFNSNMTQFSGVKAVSDASETGLFQVAVGNGEMIGGTIKYSVYVSGGTSDLQSHSGEVAFNAVNKAATVTSDIEEQYGAASESEVVTAGTLTDAWSITNGAGNITVNINADTSLSTPTLTVKYDVYLDSLNTLTPQ